MAESFPGTDEPRFTATEFGPGDIVTDPDGKEWLQIIDTTGQVVRAPTKTGFSFLDYPQDNEGR